MRWHRAGTVPGSDSPPVTWGLWLGEGRERGEVTLRGAGVEGKLLVCLFLSTDDMQMFGGWGRVTAYRTLFAGRGWSQAVTCTL